jgi:hypothetical protein
MASLASALGGILVLVLVCAFSLSAAAALGQDAAVLPLPVLCGSALLLLCFGYAGHLHGGLLAVCALLAAGTVYCAVRAGGKDLLACAGSPGFLFFAAAGLFFWILFAVLQPMFTQWDEFTFWGTAARILKDQNALYCAAPGNLAARAGMPGMALVSYLFQGLGGSFSEWQCLAAYDIFFMACLAAAAALGAEHWPHGVLLLAAGVLLPFFFSVPMPGAQSIVYLNAMGDIPLALGFGGSLCLYFAVREHRVGILFTALALGMLTAIKDMGFAYALIAVLVIWLGELARAGRISLRRFAGSAGRAALLCLPVLGVFFSWSRYYQSVTDAAKEAVGSAGLGYGEILSGGIRQLFGIGRTELFGRLMTLMWHALFEVRVCLLGSGVLALAAITVTAAAAWLFAQKGAERRFVLVTYLALGACFAVFYVFHLILYNYNFAESEAVQLKDYARYIGPYYQGWMLAMLCLLGRSAVFGVQKRFAGMALAAAALCVVGGFAVRGVPAAGFWNNASSLYEKRADVKSDAEQMNRTLNWDDRVLVLSQGDDATRWYYYNYELTATVVKGFGGRFWGQEKTYRWDSNFMNLVESLNWTYYDFQAVCTPEGLTAYLREKNCDYLIVDRADSYLEHNFSGLFQGGITADAPATLYRVVDTGTSMTFVPVENGVSEE